MNKMNQLIRFFIIIILLLVICLGIYSGCTNTVDFFKISLQQTLALVCTIVVAFWFTQYKNDERKSKDNAEKIIVKIQNIVNAPGFAIINKNIDQQIITMNKRSLHNYIDILEKYYSKKIKIESEVSYIKTKYNEYDDFVSEHISDIDYLSKSEKQLTRYAENIDNKCSEIIAKLY